MDAQELRDLAALGVTVEPQRAREESNVVEVEVEPENWDAVCVFNAMGTQWCFTSLNTSHACAVVQTGLNYASLPTVAAAEGVALDKTLMSKLRLLEQETVSICGQRTKRQLRQS